MRLTDKELEAALTSVIRPDDTAIVVYPGIWSFAHRFGIPAEQALARDLGVSCVLIGRKRGG